ncbi:MAG: hypothetical protein JNL83_36835 [Myxococcales bacterium]|nr:hypothetical protein [Myxococcales bacterium]
MRNAMLATIMFFAACHADVESSDLMLTGSEESYVINAQTGAKECVGKKELVCHIPPGNPANAHTICVSKNAVDTHESHHGDAAGACATEPPGDPGDGTLPPPGGGGECDDDCPPTGGDGTIL